MNLHESINSSRAYLLPPLSSRCDGGKVDFRGNRDAHAIISNHPLLAKLLLHLKSSKDKQPTTISRNILATAQAQHCNGVKRAMSCYSHMYKILHVKQVLAFSAVTLRGGGIIS